VSAVTSAAAEAMLEQCGDAIAAGCVGIVNVQAIRSRSGERWTKVRPHVEEFMQRAFARNVGPGAALVALNDVEFVAVQPQSTRDAAMAMNASVLKEALGFFVGKAEPGDVQLLQVTGYSDKQLSVSPLSESGAPLTGTSGLLGPSTPPAERLTWNSAARTTALVAEGSRSFDLTLRPEPAWYASGGAVPSFLLRETVTVDHGDGKRTYWGLGLPGPVAGAAALQSINYALELLRSGKLMAAVHAPVFLEALAHSNSRYALLRALKQTDLNIRRFLVLELVNIPKGFPPSRMVEVVGLLMPYARIILARVPDETTRPALWRSCGLGGVTLDCSQIQPSDRGALTRLSSFAASAAGVGPGIVGFGLRSRGLLLSAWAAGFSHVSGPALETEIGAMVGQKFAASQLYAHLRTAA
jgi:hypothetical protein